MERTPPMRRPSLPSNHAPTTPPIEIHADHSQRKRSLDSSRLIVTVEDINVGGKGPAVTNYVNRLTNASWLQPSGTFHSACQDDLVWLILRICSNTMFEKIIKRLMFRKFQVGVDFSPSDSRILQRLLPLVPSYDPGRCERVQNSQHGHETLFEDGKCSWTIRIYCNF